MKKIVLIPNRKKDINSRYTKELIGILGNYECDIEVLPDGSDELNEGGCNADLYIVLGGDGSIMRAAHIASPRNIPILGINLGRVGYMAELEADELMLIDNYFSGNYKIEERMMLSVTAPSGNEYTALNDVVLSNGTVSKMITFSLYNRDELIRTYNADGIIIATPTGSTAYSMAAGGSIIEPSLDCIAATPVCPHSFSAKPVIFSGGAELMIRNDTDRDIPIFITVDGGDNVEIGYNERVIIKRSPIITRLVRIKNESFYRILSNKMK